MKKILRTALACAVSGTVCASSPLELAVAKLDLPRLTVVVKNTGASRALRLWERGTSWGDPALHFEVFDKAGTAIGRYSSRPRSYKGNFAHFYELKPGETRSLDLDLSDKSLWSQPDKIDLKHAEGLSFCAVLNQPLDVEAHNKGAFTGEATSQRTSTTESLGAGSCVEWQALPAPGDRPRFDFAPFLESLGKLRVRQDDTNASLLDVLGLDPPWNQAAVICQSPGNAAVSYASVALLLPDRSSVVFHWDLKDTLSNTQKLQVFEKLNLPKFGDGGDLQPGWAIAADVLSKLPARGVTMISVVNQKSLWQMFYLQPDGSYQQKQ